MRNARYILVDMFTEKYQLTSTSSLSPSCFLFLHIYIDENFNFKITHIVRAENELRINPTVNSQRADERALTYW